MKHKRWLVYVLLGGVLLTACNRMDGIPFDTTGSKTQTTSVTATGAETVTTTAETVSTTVVEETVATTTKTSAMVGYTTVFESRTNVPTTTVNTTLSADLRERQLEIVFEGEAVRLSYTGEEEYERTPTKYLTLYVYEGVSRSGVPVTCKVVPSQNQIHAVFYGTPSETGKFSKEEACAFVVAEFERRRIAVPSLEEVSATMYVIDNKGNPGELHATFYVKTAPNERIYGIVRLWNGKMLLQSVKTEHTVKAYSHTEGVGETTPILTEYSCPYFVPDWV